MQSSAVKKLLCQSLAVIALASAEDVRAADSSSAWQTKAPAKAPVLAKAPAASGADWTGFYVGAHAGVTTGHSAWSATQPGGAPNLSGSLNFFRPFDVFDESGSHFAGFAAGYNYQLRSGIVLGAETDVSFPSTLRPSQNFSSPTIGAANYEDRVQTFGTVRGRLGYDANHWLYYATGGLAWTYDEFTRTQIGANPATGTPDGTIETAFGGRLGWTVGAGVEMPIVQGWTGKIEYLYSQFGNTGVTFLQGGQKFESDLSTHQVRVGLNYKLGDKSGLDWAHPMPPPLEFDNWVVHGQTTFVSQFALPFHAPYRGANSLDSNAGRETWDVTLYIGRQLWEGAQFWINPEVDQGFGLSGSFGVAAFPSAEAYKLGDSYPYFRIPRAFVRQTIDLGGAAEKVEPGINEVGGSRTEDRLVFTVGRFSVSDVFDTVTYAHDPRNDFLNWTLADAGTFDYAADAWGFTYGGAAEWYKGPWTLRAGVFDLSIVPNVVELDHRFDQFQMVGEIEHRHEINGQPGKLAVVGFLSRGRMGRFDDAVAFALANGTTPSTADVRRYATRVGANLFGEQQIVPNVAIFGRVGWADGRYETFDFTDVDRTASGGVSLGGKLWGRPDDTFGLATIFNGISAARINYLAAGGLDSLIGDGQLPHPGLEKVIEAYYRFPVGAWQVTADYQFFVNPAYNRDRGPVSVIGMRLRTQF
jgi:high affinity Mn2+ porin